MKKLLLSSAIIASLLSVSQAEEVVAPGNASGQITFEGTVTEAGCTLLPVKNVQLGSMSVAALEKGNGAWGDSKIEFIDCNLPIEGTPVEKPVTTISLTIPKGGEATTNKNLWASLGTAQNVGVEIKVVNTEVTPEGTGIQPIEGTVDTTTQTVTFPVQGRMVKDSKGVTAGTVRTTINFIANYK